MPYLKPLISSVSFDDVTAFFSSFFRGYNGTHLLFEGGSIPLRPLSGEPVPLGFLEWFMYGALCGFLFAWIVVLFWEYSARRGWTVSLQYLISLWIELAEDNRVVSFIKGFLYSCFLCLSFKKCGGDEASVTVVSFGEVQGTKSWKGVVLNKIPAVAVVKVSEAESTKIPEGGSGSEKLECEASAPMSPPSYEDYIRDIPVYPRLDSDVMEEYVPPAGEGVIPPFTDVRVPYVKQPGSSALSSAAVNPVVSSGSGQVNITLNVNGGSVRGGEEIEKFSTPYSAMSHRVETSKCQKPDYSGMSIGGDMFEFEGNKLGLRGKLDQEVLETEKKSSRDEDIDKFSTPFNAISDVETPKCQEEVYLEKPDVSGAYIGGSMSVFKGNKFATKSLPVEQDFCLHRELASNKTRSTTKSIVSASIRCDGEAPIFTSHLAGVVQDKTDVQLPGGQFNQDVENVSKADMENRDIPFNQEVGTDTRKFEMDIQDTRLNQESGARACSTPYPVVSVGGGTLVYREEVRKSVVETCDTPVGGRGVLYGHHSVSRPSSLRHPRPVMQELRDTADMSFLRGSLQYISGQGGSGMNNTPLLVSSAIVSPIRPLGRRQSKRDRKPPEYYQAQEIPLNKVLIFFDYVLENG